MNKQNLESIETVSNLLKSANAEIEKIKHQNHSWQQELEIKVKETIQNEVKKATSTNGVGCCNDNISSRRKNVIISGIPRMDDIDEIKLAKAIAETVGFNQEYWLDNCFKLASKSSSRTTSNTENFLVKFTTELNRDGFMKCYLNYIKKNNLTPATVGLNGANRIYINEHLSENLSKILREAVSMKKGGFLKKVYGHSSHIMVQSSKGWLKIRNLDELEEIKRQLK